MQDVKVYANLKMMRKFLSALFLFAIFYTLFAIHYSQPALAYIPTGQCCVIGSDVDEEKCPEGTVCQTAIDSFCQQQEKGECFMFGPYDEFKVAIEACGEGEYNRQCHTLGTVSDLLSTGIAALETKYVEDETQEEGYREEDGAVGVMANLVTNLYSIQPASSVEYIADVGNSLNLASPAYAQGFGWTAFSPVLKLWKVFRNISYLAFVIIFVVIGFMIMFRAKIDPQTVISIQSALPRIIVALLLIAFSYAIAGLIVDLGQLLTRVIGNTFREANLIAYRGVGKEAESKAILEQLLNADIFMLINPLRNVEDIVKLMAEVGVGPVAIWGIGSLTIRAIFWLAGFFIMFKIFFALIGPYVAIVLSVIFAPFQILLGAFPGGQMGFNAWLKNLLANVLVFPVTFAMLALAAVFKGGAGTELLKSCPSPPAPSLLIGGQSAPWCPGLDQVQTFWAPTTIGNWGAAAGQLIGFGILFTIPKVAEMVQSVFAIKPTPWGAAAVQEIRAAAGRVPLVGTFFGGGGG